ncbi:MAG: sulfotransferase domain-containing protein [Bauldia sp.]
MIIADPKNPKGIVWLASYPKSGNTWLRIFLYQLMRLMGGHPRDDDEINKLDRASAYESLLFGLFEQFLGKPLQGATRQEVARIRPQVHATIAERSASVALVKTHNALGSLFGVPIINLAVSAGTVYLVRDPRDIALSFATHLGKSVDDAITVMSTSGYANNNTAETAFEVWGSWSEHVHSWTELPHEAMIVVRYEDLLADPVKHFTAIVEHLRQKPSPEQIAEAIELSTFDKLRAAEDKGDFRERSERAERFFRQGRAGAWQEDLTAVQVERIVEAHGEEMRRFDYLN